jgi:hypothetical protein
MLIKQISKIAEEVGLDNVDPMGITEVLENHSKPTFSDLVQQLTGQQKEDDDEEDCGTKKYR